MCIRDSSNNPHVKKSVLERKEKQHVGWASERPNGQRGFGITGAHHHKSWDNDDFRTCVLNAIIWTAKMEVPQEGVKSSSNPTIQSKEKPEPITAKPVDPKNALFTSKLITTKTKGHAVEVKAKIKGIQNLYLTVSDGSNSYSCDWADWGLPRLSLIHISEPTRPY